VIRPSAFSAILVYARSLMRARVGLVAGMFFGFSFGLGGLGRRGARQLADATSIATVYKLTPFLMLCRLLTAFLPASRGAQNRPLAAALPRRADAVRLSPHGSSARFCVRAYVAPVLTTFSGAVSRDRRSGPGAWLRHSLPVLGVVLVVMLVTAIAYFVYDSNRRAPPSSATT